MDPTLLFSPQDLVLQLGHSGSFKVSPESPLNQSVFVKFHSERNNSFVDFDPDILEIPANDTNWFDVSVTGKTIKSCATVFANCTSDYCPLSFTKTLDITVVHSLPLEIVISVIGWIYFAAWSISFYPQIYLNFKRKSVIGLNFDFLALNVTGFLFYALYNCALFWIDIVQQEFITRHPAKIIPVLLNDVVFALHALFACIITVIQCLIYEKGHQQISKTAFVTLGTFWLTAVVATILASCLRSFLWLDLFNVLSYIKLIITLIKYVPQALYNHRRKSTVGWSIGNILLDFTGGITSLLQMILIAYNNDAFGEFLSNFTKFGLGLISLLFDLLFMFQHYVLYPESISLAPVVEESSSASSTSNDNNEEIVAERDDSKVAIIIN